MIYQRIKDIPYVLHDMLCLSSETLGDLYFSLSALLVAIFGSLELRQELSIRVNAALQLDLARSSSFWH